jgi:AmiR/NasT family two-component response regulator
MTEHSSEHLRVLIANEREDDLARAAATVGGLGHTVVEREPDVALVGLGKGTADALELIETLVRDGSCPVIALVRDPDPDFLREASARGVFAYVTDGGDWQSSIDIVLRRFADYRELAGAFGRRALIERAKGILMERHSVDEEGAFGLLRDESRGANQKLLDVASAVVAGHRLLPGRGEAPSG